MQRLPNQVALIKLSYRQAGRRRKALRAAASLIALIALSACGGGGGGGATPTAAAPVAASPAPVSPPAAPPVATPVAPAEPATLSFLHVFGVDPADASRPGGLLQASDGNFYGTSGAGGAATCSQPDGLPCGTVYRSTPAGDTTVLYSFGRSATDGWWPTGPLVQGRDGALYGMTSAGGAHGAGIAFRLTLDGVYTVLHDFGASPGDGIVPAGALLQSGDGYFYGATASGGANHCPQIPQSGGNCGTIFRMSAGGATTVLHSFGAAESDGVEPNGSLVEGPDGQLYGTTANGGANTCTTIMNPGELHNCGTVFRIARDGALTILHSFGATVADGKGAQGPLLLGRDGAFYGTTSSGGGAYGMCGWSFGCGTLFRMSLEGAVDIIYAFGKSFQDGSGPSPSLVQGADGNFYGTTLSGGAVGGASTGTVFRITPAGASTTLYSFGPVNEKPSAPGGLILARDGAFYGVTEQNGRLGSTGARPGWGTLFKLVVH